MAYSYPTLPLWSSKQHPFCRLSHHVRQSRLSGQNNAYLKPGLAILGPTKLFGPSTLKTSTLLLLDLKLQICIDRRRVIRKVCTTKGLNMISFSVKQVSIWFWILQHFYQLYIMVFVQGCIFLIRPINQNCHFKWRKWMHKTHHCTVAFLGGGGTIFVTLKRNGISINIA